MTWRFFLDFSARRIPNGRPRSRVQFNFKKKEKSKKSRPKLSSLPFQINIDIVQPTSGNKLTEITRTHLSEEEEENQKRPRNEI
jgi:hypothetical protein